MVCETQDPDRLLVPCGHVACHKCIEVEEIRIWNLLDQIAHETMEDPMRAAREQLQPICPICQEPFDRTEEIY